MLSEVVINQHMRNLLEHMPSGVALVDDELSYVIFNTKYLELFDFPADLVRPGSSMTDVFEFQVKRGDFGAGDPDALVQEMLDRYRRREPMAYERTIPGGITMHLRTTPAPGGGIVLIATDVTAQIQHKRAEEELSRHGLEQELLHRAADMASATDSIDDALRHAISMVCEMTGWPLGHVYRVSESNPKQLVSTSIWHLDDRNAHSAFREVTERTNLSIGEGLPGRILASGEPAWIPDVNLDDNFPRAKLLHDLSIHGAFGFPVTIAGQSVAVLEFFSEAKMAPDEKLLQIMRNVGAQLGRVFERKRSQDEANRRASQLRTILKRIPAGVYLADADLEVEVVNDQLSHLYGIPDGMVQEGTSLEPAIRWLAQQGTYREMGENLERTVASRVAALKSGKLMKTEHTPPSGLNVQTSHGPVDGGGVCAVVTEITDLKRTEQQLRAARDEAENALDELRRAQAQLVQSQKMASLGQLTAGIAHEIKNPLNFVNNFSETSVELLEELDLALNPMQTEMDEDTRENVQELITALKEDLSSIAQHGKRADNIMRSMLMHAREQPVDRERVDINELLEEALKLAYHSERARHSGFNADLKKELDSSLGDVMVSKEELTRVLVNLYANGFYALRSRQLSATEESYQPQMHTATCDLGHQVEIRIRDNGTGMQPDVVDKLFTPFFTTKPPSEGTGLGLSICYDIVTQDHHGRIEVESEYGDHTEFIITLSRDGGNNE